VVVSLMAFYVIAANLILNTELLTPLISRRPEKMLVEWESGWTIVPGFIHVEGLRIRGQSKGKQWQCRLSEGDIRFSLLPLASKTFRVRRARGGDFEFRLRSRLTEETGDLPGSQFFPEIEGLSNPPDPAPEDIYPPKDKTKKGWHIDLSDIRFRGAIELWFGRLQIGGTGLVGGDVDYQIRGNLHLPQTIFDLDDGTLTFDGRTMVQDLHISADLAVTPFKPREVKGTAIFDNLLGSWQLENGTIPDLEIVNRLLPTSSALQLRSGTASFRWAFDKPSIEAGSSGALTIAATGADMTAAGRQMTGNFSLSSQLVRGSLAEGSWNLGETTVALENILIALTGEDEPADEAGAPVETWWARTTLTAGRLELGDPGTLTAQLEFEMKNTDPLLDLFLAKTNEEGKTKVPGWAKLLPDIQNLEGRATLRADERGIVIDDLVIDGDKFDLMARFKAAGEQVDGQLYVRYKGLDFGLDMRDGKSDLKILRPKKWFLEQLELDDSATIEPPDEVGNQADG